MSVEIEFSHGDNGAFLYKSNLDMLRGVTYFISILPPVPFDLDPNINSIDVKMFEHNKLIHNEKMHLRLK
jgi:hypothetical protein